jgi:hypothetical protein
MVFNYKVLCSALVCFSLSSCISSYHVKDVEKVISDSPKIEIISKEKFQPRTEPENVEIFYRFWNPLTRPDAVKNWKYYFVMGEGSSPAWEFTEISQIIHAQRARDDSKAITEFKSIAHKQGGDAILDMHREPMIDGPKFGSKVIGYRYYGSVIRKN